jgi:hypothetical protein
MMMAMTSRMWINPPIVKLVTSPSSHSTTNITTIVQSIHNSFRFAISESTTVLLY